MREIIFRGKRIDNGELVYGDLTQDRDLETAYIQGHDYYTDDCGPQREPFCCEVDPETVGQYTGVKDCKGKRIFEGDVLRGYNTYDFKVYIEYGHAVIKWEDSGEKLTECLEADYIKDNDVEIIGNIHDNPELLEVK